MSRVLSTMRSTRAPTKLRSAASPNATCLSRTERHRVWKFLLLFGIYWIGTTQGSKSRPSRNKRLALHYEVCGGYTNQRLSVTFATLLALNEGFSHISLPTCLADALAHDFVAFNELFDVQKYTTMLESTFQLRIIEQTTRESGYTFKCSKDASLSECLRKLKRLQKTSVRETSHILIECPFLSKMWDAAYVFDRRHDFDMIYSSLVATQQIRELAADISSRLRSNSQHKCTSFVHLRIEDDWVEHCDTWTKYKSVPLDRCYVGLSKIASRLKHSLDSNCNLLVSYDSARVSPALQEEINYHFPNSKKSLNFERITGLPREVSASLEYHLATRESDFFAGNTISTFSAMILRDRQKNKKPAVQYNRGHSDLPRFVPGFLIPWVFVARGTDTEYDEMMLVAVRSAKQIGILLPFCLVHPSEAHFRRVDALQNEGVQVIIHEPRWEAAFMRNVASFSDSEKKHSHLYGNNSSLLGTFFRFDIPILAELQQFEHVLYTDTDVFFRKPMEHFLRRVILPGTLKMGFEGADQFPLNAGVYLASIPYLRSTHADLIAFLLSSRTLFIPGFGPGDQGILNKFFHEELVQSGVLERVWNTEAHKAFSRNAAIIHFRGPKPKDFLHYINTGECLFGKMCKHGVKHGFCRYFAEWSQHLSSDFQQNEFYSLERACHLTDGYRHRFAQISISKQSM